MQKRWCPVSFKMELLGPTRQIFHLGRVNILLGQHTWPSTAPRPVEFFGQWHELLRQVTGPPRIADFMDGLPSFDGHYASFGKLPTLPQPLAERRATCK